MAIDLSNLTGQSISNNIRTIISQAQALGFKLPATVQAKLNRDKYLNDLVEEITQAEIEAATPEDVPALVERIARNSAFQNPTAQDALGKLRRNFDQDLQNTLRGSAEELYDAVAKKVNKEFSVISTDACAVPYAFAANPALWERQGRETIDAYKRLRISLPAVAPLVNLLNLIAITFFPALPADKWELAAIANLQPFYNFTGQTSPKLAQLKLPANAPLVSLEMVTYLAERDIFLGAQSLQERHATESALIAQASGWVQLSGGKWVTSEEAAGYPQSTQGLAIAHFNENAVQL
ncbi:hypothetical protein [Amycolatopsis nalaikhensis]|uniref:Uncharacterized protein n=1 Tax=Amycolatopsis nalaikhensis TaxID=715472 RepID=A0ABY8XP69_9PSEU|nr:hypothetical protein [Amycolatopsis sp. 2-2]WIV57439.1 hypothetical protein QP939_01730 [Amycolatopsis sp. 2-2]